MLFNKLYLTLLLVGISFVCNTIKPIVKVAMVSNKVSTIKSVKQINENTEKVIINDGPYVFNQDNHIQAFWLCNGDVEKVIYQKKLLPKAFLNHCNSSVIVDRIDFVETSILEFQGDFPVVATSDFHGQYDVMMSLLKNNGVVNNKLQWSFGRGHFVITGDVFDRGDKVTEILWFLYRLEKEAEIAGGKLHLLLGNHEVMVLNGDLRYLHPKYVEVATKLNQPFEQLYGKGTVLGDWLRSKPVLVKINNMLFAHGGFHPSLAQEKRTLKSINNVFKSNLVKSELAKPREGWGKYLHKSNGPIWYRGYFKDDGASAQEIDLLLEHFDISHLVVGHTSQKQVETRHHGRVIAIDSSIKKGSYGELLFVDGDKLWRGNLKGIKLPLVSD